MKQNDAAVYRAPADGSAKASLLQRADAGLWEAEVSRDGAWIVMRKDVNGSRNVLLARNLSGDTALRTARQSLSCHAALVQNQSGRETDANSSLR